MLTALILICSSVAHDLSDCTRTNARVVMSTTAETRNPITCFMHVQAYIAKTSLGQDLSADDRVQNRLRAKRYSDGRAVRRSRNRLTQAKCVQVASV